jgi:hypothetical protein
VIGAVWNYNSTSMITVGEKEIKGPQLLVLSSLGVLVSFKFYNFYPGFEDQTQILDRLHGVPRESLKEKTSAPKPRASIPKPLARTSSVMPGAPVPNITKGTELKSF